MNDEDSKKTAMELAAEGAFAPGGKKSGGEQKDFTLLTDAALAEAEKMLASSSNARLVEALDSLNSLEKQTRTSADIPSNTRILVANVTFTHRAGDWKLMGERVTLLSKKHGLLKTSVSKMIQEVVSLIEKTPDKETKLLIIDMVRTVTDGKIFVEVERARVTRMLAKIKEDEGNVKEAADILQDLQVETYGSMDKREKTDFILEQMRLCIAKDDYTRAQILSKKISVKFFDDVANQDLKLRYYHLMIQHSIHAGEYLSTCKYYRHIYNTPSIQESEEKWTQTLQAVVAYVVLAAYDNEQSDLIHRIYEDPKLTKLTLFKDFTKCFITHELVRWPKMDEIYGAALKKAAGGVIFDLSTEGGVARWKALHDRVIEHNIRVVAKYYTRITMSRLKQLLDLSEKEAESFLSSLVTSKTVYARIDRPRGCVSFVPASKGPTKVLNEWSADVNSLLQLISKTTHLIAKEDMVQSIALAL